jgi:hypothetical protein
MSQVLYLYTTDHCHLCDEAMTLLLTDPGIAPALAGLRLVTVDVALDDDLLARFGEQVPVLARDEATLGWPFDGDAVRQFLERA